MKKTIPLTIAAVAAVLLAVPSAKGISTYMTRADWEGSIASWTDVDLLAQGIVEGQPVSSVALPFGGLGLAFDPGVTAAQVGSGWATWSPPSTPSTPAGDPMVLYTFGQSVVVDVTPSPLGYLSSFGLEMENNIFDVLMTLTFADNTSMSQLVAANSGAQFFGWTGGSVAQFTLSTEDPLGFAFGRMVQGDGSPTPGVPDGGSLGLMGGLVWAGLLGLGTLRRKTS